MPHNYCSSLRMELLSLWCCCKQGRNHPIGWSLYTTDSQHRCRERRTRAFQVFRLIHQLTFISGGFFACVWGWSLDLLDVRGQNIERHVPPRWHNDQSIGVCSNAVTWMNPFLLPAFLKWHPHIKNVITLTLILTLSIRFPQIQSLRVLIQQGFRPTREIPCPGKLCLPGRTEIPALSQNYNISFNSFLNGCDCVFGLIWLMTLNVERLCSLTKN